MGPTINPTSAHYDNDNFIAFHERYHKYFLLFISKIPYWTEDFQDLDINCRCKITAGLIYEAPSLEALDVMRHLGP